MTLHPYTASRIARKAAPLIALAAVGLHSQWKRGRVAARRCALPTPSAIGIALTPALMPGVWG